ncbi:MAG: hypothetical protein N2Z69_08785 [Methylophilaceae bacterium]|nr:hypothetical protein [Methylophilaceae bacterium]
MTPQYKGRLMFLLLLGVFALPVVVGFCLYVSGHRLEGKSYGQLLQPPRKLQASSALDWHGKWRMVYVTDPLCANECLITLQQLRQLHVSMAKDIDRLQRIWVIDGNWDEKTIAPIRRQYPDLLIMSGAQAMAAGFPVRGATGEVFLVDPLGYLMMRYPSGFEPAGVRKDLVRLLTYSWVG